MNILVVETESLEVIAKLSHGTFENRTLQRGDALEIDGQLYTVQHKHFVYDKRNKVTLNTYYVK
jgi:RNase P/RNase MRP subunit p29